MSGDVSFDMMGLIGSIVFLAVGGLIAVSPALWRRRGGWFGIPAGSAFSIGSLFYAFDIDERLLMVYWAGVPAFMASRLPLVDALFATAFGLATAIAFLFFIPNGGPDSPVNIIIAVCGLGFAIGATISSATGFARSSRLNGASTSG